MNRKHILKLFLVAAFSFAAGAYSYFSFVVPYTYYKRAAAAIVANNETIQNLQRAVAVSHSLLYGTVSAVNADDESLDVAVESPYQPGVSATIRLRLLPTTYVAKQYLTQDGGAYASLSPRQSASFGDIRPGDRVAFSPVNSALNASGVLVASYLLFGYPL